MKKLSLLISTLGGAMGGYLLSNKKLREELVNAKDTEAAAKSLGKHLQRDGKKIAEQMRDFVESEDVQANLTKAKSYTKDRVDEAKQELNKMVDTGTDKAKKTVKRTATKAKKGAKQGAAKAKTAAKTTAKRTSTKAKKAAGKTARRVKAKTRKLS
jgi:hypothetical protein